jgi:hypothetical protein
MSWRETSAPTTIPFWARCNNPFHLLVLTTFLTQVSLVTIGHRAGRSSAFGLAEAELLSASFRPNGLPSRYACCVALTPLSKRNFYEVISCAVKGRAPLRTARTSFPVGRSSLSNALLRTRWHHVQRLAMDLSMAVGMQEHTILCRIAASIRPPDDMMVMPSRQVGDVLVAHGT